MELPLQSIFIFNTWPEVSINRNDSEIQMFSKYFATVEKNEILNHITNNFNEDEPKSKIMANTFRTKGNACYKMLDFDSALELYNISISRAPRDSTEFGLAIANRSAALFDMKKYKECIEDIDVVFRSEYPKNLLYKVYVRQCKCYLELNLVNKAEESLQKLQGIKKKGLGQLIIGMIEDNIKNLITQVKGYKVKPLSIEESNDYLLPEPTLLNGENQRFLSASNAINFKHNTPLERCVIASSDIKKGDVLFIEQPYAMTALNRKQKRFTICAFCLQTSRNCIPCTTCTTNSYCSSKCQVNAWDLSHKWECVSDRRQIITDIRQKLSLAILLKASHNNFKTEVEDAYVYGNKDNNYPFMNKLLTHKNEIPEFALGYNIKSAVWMVMYLKNFTDYFDWLYIQPNRPEGSQEDLYNFVGGHLVKYLLQVGCNLNVIQEGEIYLESDNSASVNYLGLGIGIYLSSALLNHSCLPNVVNCYHGCKKIVRALKDINEGSEILVNYLGGQEEKQTEERQSELEKYVFRCSCVMCTNTKYEEIFNPLLCFKCHGKAYPFKGKKKLSKCTQCNWVFNHREHNRNENKIVEYLLRFQITGEFFHKDTLYNLIKKTYHKDNVTFIAYHHACLKHYEEIGDHKKTIDTFRALGKISESIYGDTSRQYLITMLQCTYSLVEYSNKLKMEKSPLYDNFVMETKKYLKKSVECLQYYLCPKTVNIFVENIKEYLKSGEIREQIEAYEQDSALQSLTELCAFLR